MKVLISPINVAEAVIAHDCGTDIIDIKNIDAKVTVNGVAGGSLGASTAEIIREVITTISDPKVIFSATLGDLSGDDIPLAPARAQDFIGCGVNYIKVGLCDFENPEQATRLMKAVRAVCPKEITLVAAGYADAARFGGLKPNQLIKIAYQSGADMVMLDTFVKDGKTLLHALSPNELFGFTKAAHDCRLGVALAGSIGIDDFPILHVVGADVVGLRGAVCDQHDRTTMINPDKAKALMAAARAFQFQPAPSQSFTAAAPHAF